MPPAAASPSLALISPYRGSSRLLLFPQRRIRANMKPHCWMLEGVFPPGAVPAAAAAVATAGAAAAASALAHPAIIQALASSLATSFTILHVSDAHKAAATAAAAAREAAAVEAAAARPSSPPAASAAAAAAAAAAATASPTALISTPAPIPQQPSSNPKLQAELPIASLLAAATLFLLCHGPEHRAAAAQAAAAAALTLEILRQSPAGRDRPKAPLRVRALYVATAAVTAAAAASPTVTLLTAAALSAPQLARAAFASKVALGSDAANRLRIGGGPVVLFLAILSAVQYYCWWWCGIGGGDGGGGGNYCGGGAVIATLGLAAATGLATWLAPDGDWPPPRARDATAAVMQLVGLGWASNAARSPAFLHSRLMMVGSGLLAVALMIELMQR